MPAPKRVPDARVIEAIRTWRGDVSAAAAELGIARNNLYQRLARLGVSPEELRRKSASAPQSAPINAAVVKRDVPIRTIPPRKQAMPRIMPAHVDRLRAAKFDLCSLYQVETDETTILGQFFDEAFGLWLASKLEPKS